MTQEIVFTSSERGLRAGSTGFCTVRSTVGLPPNLASLLEQLTGYTHPYDAYDLSLFDKHPVNFAHYISRVGGQKFHILCRICNAPLDHTNRSNKLAHLIALEEGEIDLTHTQGPASAINWMIPPPGKNQEPGDSRYWITSWPSNREPCVLPDSKRLVLPSVNDKSGPCTVWKQVLGDSGWAAVLAESIQDRKRQTVPVVFSSEQKDKCLDLVQEALSLLSPAERWGVTFSTFQSGSLPTKVECRWQFLLDSTDLAKKALRNQRRTPVIDLTSLKGSKSPASELTAFTNTGKRPWDKVSVSLSQPVAPKQPAPASKQPAPSKRYAEPVLATDDFDDDFDDDGLDSPADGYPLRPRASRRVPRRGKAAPPLRRARKSQSSGRLMAIAGAIIVLGAVAMLIFQGQPTKQQDELIAKSSPLDGQPGRLPDDAQRNNSSDNDPARVDTTDSASGDTKQTTQVEVASPPEDATSTNDSENETEATVSSEKPKRPTPSGPLDDLKGNLEDIANEFENAHQSKSRDPIILSNKVLIDSSDDLELKFAHHAAVKNAGYIMLPPKRDGNKWEVKAKDQSSGASTRPNTIGVFTLESRKLSFRFGSKPHLALNHAFLETAISFRHTKDDKTDPVICRLGIPDLKPSLRPGFDNSKAFVTLLDKQFIGAASVKEKFKLTCTINGLPDEIVVDNNVLKPVPIEYKTKKRTFDLFNKDGKREKRFTREVKIEGLTLKGPDIVVSLDMSENGLEVHCKQMVTYLKLGELNSIDTEYKEYIQKEFTAKSKKMADLRQNNAAEKLNIDKTLPNKLAMLKKQKEAHEMDKKNNIDGKLQLLVVNLQNRSNELKTKTSIDDAWNKYSKVVKEMRKKFIGEDINGNGKLDAMENRNEGDELDPGSVYIRYDLIRNNEVDKQAIIVTSVKPVKSGGP